MDIHGFCRIVLWVGRLKKRILYGKTVIKWAQQGTFIRDCNALA